jgi:hypothetical protein
MHHPLLNKYHMSVLEDICNTTHPLTHRRFARRAGMSRFACCAQEGDFTAVRLTVGHAVAATFRNNDAILLSLDNPHVRPC